MHPVCVKADMALSAGAAADTPDTSVEGLEAAQDSPAPLAVGKMQLLRFSDLEVVMSYPHHRCYFSSL